MDSVCVDLREKGLSGEEKGRKSEVEMDGQCVCGLEREWTVRGGEGKEERSGGGCTAVSILGFENCQSFFSYNCPCTYGVPQCAVHRNARRAPV